MLQDLALGPNTVDVSMATLATVWTHEPCDLSERQHEPLAVWGPQSVCNSPSPAGVRWMEQLSPQLQRNKQLQDTLLQREEELSRLQDENNKLRKFLKSSFVRDLEKKAKRLTAEGRMKLKRNLMNVSNGPSQNYGHQLVDPQQISKRVCRNLTAEFCSEFHETAASSESTLDLWVLRMLGLKDRDTIDTCNEFLPSSESSLSLGHDSAGIASSEHTLSISPAVTTSTPLSAYNYCQNKTQQTQHYNYDAECREANFRNFTADPGQHPDFSASGLTEQYEIPYVVTRSYYTAFQSQLPLSQSPDGAEICSTTASNPVQPLQRNQAELSSYWAPLQGSQTPPQDIVLLSSPGDGKHSTPALTSSPVMKGQVVIRGCSPSTKCQPPATHPTRHGRTDLAFSMSLSPSSSVKTHSFPQGQAFVRKDSEGQWNFTWVPRQGP